MVWVDVPGTPESPSIPRDLEIPQRDSQLGKAHAPGSPEENGTINGNLEAAKDINHNQTTEIPKTFDLRDAARSGRKTVPTLVCLDDVRVRSNDSSSCVSSSNANCWHEEDLDYQEARGGCGGGGGGGGGLPVLTTEAGKRDRKASRTEISENTPDVWTREANDPQVDVFEEVLNGRGHVQEVSVLDNDGVEQCRVLGGGCRLSQEGWDGSAPSRKTAGGGVEEVSGRGGPWGESSVDFKPLLEEVVTILYDAPASDSDEAYDDDDEDGGYYDEPDDDLCHYEGCSVSGGGEDDASFFLQEDIRVIIPSFDDLTLNDLSPLLDGALCVERPSPPSGSRPSSPAGGRRPCGSPDNKDTFELLPLGSERDKCGSRGILASCRVPESVGDVPDVLRHIREIQKRSQAKRNLLKDTYFNNFPIRSAFLRDPSLRHLAQRTSRKEPSSLFGSVLLHPPHPKTSRLKDPSPRYSPLKDSFLKEAPSSSSSRGLELTCESPGSPDSGRESAGGSRDEEAIGPQFFADLCSLWPDLIVR